MQTSQKTMRAALYARYSSDKQRESSIADQFYNAERLAERLVMHVVARFEDKAITGTHTARPGYQLMLDAAQRGDFDVLIVDDLSRLSRDSVEVQRIIREFKFRRQRVIAVSDGFDSNDKSYKLQAGVRGIVNDIYIDDLREKTRRGLSGKARAGLSTGGSAYGYARKPLYDTARKDEFGRPLVIAVERVIDHEQAKWVVKIFEWFAEGHPPMWIAAKLNELGIPSPRGTTWARSAIYGDSKQGTGLLNNELYIGRMQWNRREWVKTPEGKRIPLKRDMGEHVVVEKPDLRIISDELWQAKCERQQEIKKRARGGGRTGAGPKYLFSGLLKCGECGANYTVVSRRMYGCAKHKERGAHACKNSITVRQEVVEGVLLTGIRDRLLSPAAMQEFLRECNAQIGEMESAVADERRSMETRARQLETELKNMMNYIKSGVALPSLADEIRKAEEEKRRIDQLLKQESPAAAEIMKMVPRAMEKYREYVGGLANIGPDRIVEAQQQLRMLTGGEVKLIPVDGDGLAAEVNGDFAAILGDRQINVVAGARNGIYLLRFILKQPTGKHTIADQPQHMRLIK